MKILVVKSSHHSPWTSAQTIINNVIKALQLLPEHINLTIFELSPNFFDNKSILNQKFAELLKEIEKEKITHLFFLDHIPHLPDLLCELNAFIPLNKLPPVMMMIYGDFHLHIRSWVEAGKHLSEHPVKIFVGSESQSQLVKHFLKTNTNIHVVPFAVNPDHFYFDKKGRDLIRKQKKIDSNVKVMIYSGRISMQKNVDLLIEEFFKRICNSKEDWRLWILGDFDNLGAKFTGKKTLEGHLYFKINRLLNSYPESLKSRVEFWGKQSHHSLKDIYSAADAFVSYSLHHDEDFGMAPAEALACGLPCLLSAWAGYNSFKPSTNDEWVCELAEVSFAEIGHNIEVEKIELFSRRLYSDIERQVHSEKFLQSFSHSAAATKFYSEFEKPFFEFKGFSIPSDSFPFDDEQGASAQLLPSMTGKYNVIYKNYLNASIKRSSEHLQNVHWMFDFLECDNNQSSLHLTESDSFKKKLSPFFNPYFVPEGLIVREGPVYLKVFFEKNPDINTPFIYIDPEDINLVPAEWKEKVGFYQYKTRRAVVVEPISVIFSGHSLLADENFILSIMSELKMKYGSDKLKKMTYYIYSPLDKDGAFVSFLKKTILDQLQIHAVTVELQNLIFGLDLKNSLYVELNDGLLLRDSYVRQVAFSRGSSEFKLSKNQKSALEKFEHFRNFPVSLYHDLNFYKPVTGKTLHEK